MWKTPSACGQPSTSGSGLHFKVARSSPWSPSYPQAVRENRPPAGAGSARGRHPREHRGVVAGLRLTRAARRRSP